MNADEIALKVAEKLREEARKQGNIPFLSGDLRKSIQVDLIGEGKATIGSNLAYARAVHDGRKALTIRPNLKKNPPLGKRNLRGTPKSKYRSKARLKFKIGGQTVFAREVHQKERKARPFLRDAFKKLQDDGFEFLKEPLAESYGDELADKILKNIEVDFKI